MLECRYIRPNGFSAMSYEATGLLLTSSTVAVILTLESRFLGYLYAPYTQLQRD